MLCFICKKRQGNANVLIKHFKLIHGLCSGKNLHLKSAQVGCSHVYGTFSGLRKHLSKAHDHFVKSYLNAGDGLSTAPPQPNIPSGDLDLPAENVPCDSVLCKSLKDSCATTVAELKVAGVGETTINHLVTALEEIVDVYEHAKESLKNCLSSSSTADCKIDQCFENFLNPFSALNSESKRTQYFTDKWGKVDPVDHVLGTRFATRRNRTTGTYDQVVVRDTFVYIPILETLKSIYKNPNVMEMMKRDSEQRENMLYDLCDGDYFKSHALFSTQRHAIQIQLFYDDFETANPLGSKRGIHKLGAIYFTLRNFSPKYNSRLLNIHLVSLFHAQDIKMYGFNKILHPVVQDIKILESDGIQVPLFKHPIYGTIVQVTGDNLGLHCLFGFVESFSARYCCRFCLAEKGDFQTEFSEDSPKLTRRTKAVHVEHCEEWRAIQVCLM